jgi:hypothetical protein
MSWIQGTPFNASEYLRIFFSPPCLHWHERIYYLLQRFRDSKSKSAELNIDIVKNQNMFLIQHAAKTVPMPLQCLHMQLITDYYFRDGVIKEYFQDAALKDEEDKAKHQDHSMTMLYFLIMSLQPR